MLVILVDTLRQDRLGCYGYDRPVSPEIDRIAAEAWRFQRAYSVSSWTKPAIPSLFTGLYPSQHRVFEGNTEAGAVIRTDLLSVEAQTMAEVFKARGYRTGAFVHNAHLQDGFGFAQGFDVYDESPLTAAEQVSNLLAWLEAGEGSFFAYLHILDVHWPYEPARRDLQALGLESLAGSYDLESLEAVMDGARDPIGGEKRLLSDLYDAGIVGVDRAIGMLRDQMIARDDWDETVVVLTSDHGEAFFEHGSPGHGHDLSEELTRIPLLIKVVDSHPEIRVGHQPASLVDILPTVFELAAGQPLPYEVAGRSLVVPRARESGSEVELAELRHGNRMERALWQGAWKLLHREPASGARLPHGEQLERPDALRGLRVEMELARQEETWYANAVEIELPRDDDDEFMGRLEAIDFRQRSAKVAGVGVRFDSDLEIEDGADPAAFVPGAWVKVEGFAAATGLIADKLELRDGDDTEVEGLVNSSECEEGWCRLRVAGLDVVCAQTTIVGALSLAQQTYAGAELTSRELYDLENDPGASRDRASIDVGRANDFVARLDALLAELEVGAIAEGGDAELDVETIESLRALGYL